MFCLIAILNEKLEYQVRIQVGFVTFTAAQIAQGKVLIFIPQTLS